MTRALPLALVIFAAACAAPTAERFRPKGLYNNALHRFFPDLDSRENAVCYERWRAFDSPDRARSARFVPGALARVSREPSFPPDPRLCAPRLARRDPDAFRRLVAAEALEREIADALAAADASPDRTPRRVARAVEEYRRTVPSAEPDATAAPATPESDGARLLAAGETLFVRAAEDLSGADYSEQRWLVRDEVDRYDASVRSLSEASRWPSYAELAPSFAKAYPEAAALLDRAIALRARVLEPAP